MNVTCQKIAVKQCKELLMVLGGKSRNRKQHSGATVKKRKKKKREAADEAAAPSAKDTIANVVRVDISGITVTITPLKEDKRVESLNSEKMSPLNGTSLFRKVGLGDKGGAIMQGRCFKVNNGAEEVESTKVATIEARATEARVQSTTVAISAAAAGDAYGTDDSPPLGSDNVPQSGPQFLNNTPVSDYEDGEWIDGEVVLFKDGNYIVQWSDEKVVEYYASSNAKDMQTLKKMVENTIGKDNAAPSDFVSTQELWEDGTRVTFAKDGVWYMGTTVSFSQNKYEIEWDDGEVEIEDNLDLFNQMVADGITNNPYAAIGDNAATAALGDHGVDGAETPTGKLGNDNAAAIALVKLSNDEDVAIAPGKNDTTTGEISDDNAATGALVDDGAGGLEPIAAAIALDTGLSCESSFGGITAADPEVLLAVEQAIADPVLPQAAEQVETVKQALANPVVPQTANPVAPRAANRQVLSAVKLAIADPVNYTDKNGRMALTHSPYPQPN